MNRMRKAGIFDPTDPMSVYGQAGSEVGGTGNTAALTSGDSNSVVTGPQLTLPRAEIITIRFGVITPPAGKPFAAVATIQGYVGGNGIQRQVSISQGTAISMVAEKVSLTLQDQTALIATGGNLGFGYGIVTQIARGVRASYLSPPTLFDYGSPHNIPNSGNVTIPIPQNAGVESVEVQAVNFNPPVMTVTKPVAFSVAALAPSHFLKVWDPTYSTGFIVLPPGATSLILTNDAAGVNAQVSATVTWGIEG